MKTVWQSIRMLAVLSVLTGLVYPLAMTGIAQALFWREANGSLVVVNDAAIGSELVGQPFTSVRYFWPRPSALGYNPLLSAGTNLGPASKVLRDSVAARAARLGAPVATVPSDLLLASGSGLDPHISPEAAEFQVARVLSARGMPVSRRNELQTLIQTHTELPQFGIFGEPRVNVLLLNLALDSLMQ